MVYKLFVTARAESSLEDISIYYLSEHSRQGAVKVIKSIEDAFESIRIAPQRHPVCFDIAIPVENIRQMIIHNTLKIIYKIIDNRIEIIEVFHGSRNNDLLKDIED